MITYSTSEGPQKFFPHKPGDPPPCGRGLRIDILDTANNFYLKESSDTALDSSWWSSDAIHPIIAWRISTEDKPLQSQTRLTEEIKVKIQELENLLSKLKNNLAEL